MTEENKKPLEEILQGVNDTTAVSFFNNSKYVGLEIGVSRTGWGWGAITISHNLEKDTWHMDDEYTSRERVTQFLHDAVPHIVEALYRKGDVKFELAEDRIEPMDISWTNLEKL